MADTLTQTPGPVVGTGYRHDSAHLHVAGKARYIDDEPEPPHLLHLAFGVSSEARARIVAEHGDDASPAAIAAMEHEAVRVSLANLHTFPFVSERIAAGTLGLKGAHFAIADGKLRVLGEDGEFAPA